MVHIRDPQMAQDKAQFAVNGRSLDKGCNAELSHLWVSLRACREAVICGVASLGKDQPFLARRALQPTVSHHADMCHSWLTPHSVFFAAEGGQFLPFDAK
jgi:hypothetical protein